MNKFIHHPTSSLISQFRYHVSVISTVPTDPNILIENFDRASDLIDEIIDRGELHLVVNSKPFKRWSVLNSFWGTDRGIAP